eukprot:COSAG02_NODE_64834_length_259_cov_0.962500_1_plen_61_part_10
MQDFVDLIKEQHITAKMLKLLECPPAQVHIEGKEEHRCDVCNKMYFGPRGAAVLKVEGAWA